MMEIGHLSPRQVDEMSLWEVKALIAYHNYAHAKEEDRTISDGELAEIESWLNKE
jgi:hypothetical protein